MKEIECPNCGAVYEAGEAKCPYCGHIDPMGAEAKFLRDLEGTRKKLDSVDDEAKQAYSGEIKKGARSTVKVILIVAIVIAILVGVVHVLNNTMFYYGFKGDYQKELAWEHERFLEYDVMLDNGEYEKLMEAIAIDGEEHDVWSWERYDEFMAIADELWGTGSGEDDESE